MKKENIFYPKILFTTGLPNVFRGLHIANLYEIAQVYPVVLLADENIDRETKEVLNKKELFPKLEEIIFYQDILSLSPKSNYRNYKLAKKVIEQYRPDIIIASDMCLFHLYLSRFARKIRPILHIALQGGLSTKTKDMRLRSCLMSAHLKTPSFLPLSIRLFLTKCKRYIADFFYYWILPLTVGQLPFLGKSSFISIKGAPGLRSCDYFLLRSKRDCDFVIQEDEVSPEKLYIVAHPLLRKETREFLRKNFFENSVKQHKNSQKTVTILYSGEEVEFKRNDYSLISKKEIREMRLEVIRLVAQILKDWQIIIKPHPLTENINKIKDAIEAIAPNIRVAEQSDPIDRYIEISDIIIGPTPSSTVLYTATIQRPEKIILSLDLYQEFHGDIYKDAEGIEYIDEKEKFIDVLREIRDGKFRKKRQEMKSELEPNKFPNLVEAIKYFLVQKT